MKKLLLIILTGIACLSGMLLNACNSTRLVSSWKAPDGALQSYHKILVIGVMGAKDREIREKVENEIVTGFQARGINAGSAYAEYGPKTFENMNENTVLKKMRDKEYDGTFTIALLDKAKQKRYVPGSVSYFPGPYYDRFWGYYSTVYSRLYEPGYYTITTNYLLEANFYNLTTGKLLYSAQTKSFDPGNAQKLASDFSKTVLDDMAKKGIIK
jgi:hypothetical protein